MKRYVILLAAAVFLFCNARGQLTSAEYFFDTDPGVRNGTPLSVTAGDSILFSGTISTIGLSNGFHFLSIRSKSTGGAWSISERRMLYIRPLTPAAVLSAAEYFFDNDPGVGSGTPLTVTGSDSVVFAGIVSTASLSNGFHFLSIRAKDANGTWSIAERRMFFIRTVYNAPQLTAAEYFFDTDPGVGSGTSLVVTGGDSIVFAGIVPATSLADGFHYLSIRVRDTDGHWSIAERRMFFVRAVYNAPQITKAEYFFDTDPGVGSGTALTVTAGDSVVFSGPVPVGSLGTGFHFLNIRTMGQDGKWSISERRMFYIEAQYTAGPLVAAEFFVGTDPGNGQGTPITVTAGDSIDFTGLLAITQTDTAIYMLNIRVRDTARVWSIYATDTFAIVDNIGVKEVGADGQPVLYQNYPNPFAETTTISFYIRQRNDVNIYIMDVTGRLVRELRFENLPPGIHSATFNSASLADGYYTCRMITGKFTQVKQMALRH